MRGSCYVKRSFRGSKRSRGSCSAVSLFVVLLLIIIIVVIVISGDAAAYLF